MKQLISKKYRHFVLYLEISVFVIMLPILYNFVPINQGNDTFYLSSSKIDDISKTLEENGYTVTAIDRVLLQLIHTPQEGWYTVDKNEHGRLLFFQCLHQKKSKTIEIVVYAGETAEELTTRLSKNMKLNKEELLQAYQTFTEFSQADIFAKRYTIARQADENSTMKYLFDLSSKALKAFEKRNFSKKPDHLKLKTLLTIASIIQKESNSVEEMPSISSVIHNRLNKGMRLQMDSTLNYGKYSHIVITPKRIKGDTSYFNTYKYKGLPPYPLGTVTMDALQAAIHPIKSDYLFFMLNKKGKHDFAATYKKHLENLKAFRVHQKEKAKPKRIKSIIEVNNTNMVKPTKESNSTLNSKQI